MESFSSCISWLQGCLLQAELSLRGVALLFVVWWVVFFLIPFLSLMAEIAGLGLNLLGRF